MFNNLLGNATIKKMFFKQFKGIVKDNGIKSILIKMDEDENKEPTIDTYTEEIVIGEKSKFVLVPIGEYNKMVNQLMKDL